ncbi:MAG: inositol monophosphatase family protein [Desulfosoma sp.]|uniref:inositol monophosphatase family protein n=1 Tax=Desulfosoma sp. TaxID=2603217 RepID=UPI00404A32D0
MSQDGAGIGELREFALDTIRQAGREALRYYGKGRKDVKFDEDLVTEAELHLTRFFHDTLYARFPEHEVFGDAPPRTDYVHGHKGYLWVYDALDGVANFQAGIPLWGTSLALLENFWPVLGIFHMPVTGECFYAEPDRGAFLNDTSIGIAYSGEINNESLLFTYSRMHEHFRSNFPGKIRNLGCTAAHISYVAMGRAEGAFMRSVSYQDLAAAQIILQAAGGSLRFLDGRPFHLNEYFEAKRVDGPLLAAPEGAHALIRGYVRELSDL